MSIGKRLRFKVFDRDEFKCRYCGKDSSEAKLEVDHIHPASKGGTDEIENLVTACFSCNRGKADKLIGSNPINEKSRLYLLQELRELEEGADATRRIMDARREKKAAFYDGLFNLGLFEEIDDKTFKILFRYTEEYGVPQVLSWVELAADCTDGSSRRIGMYVSGIRRKVKALEDE